MNANFQSALLCLAALCIGPAPRMQAQQPEQPPEQPPAQTAEEPGSGEDLLSSELDGWQPQTHPLLRGGAADTNTDPGNLSLSGHVAASPGVTASFPAGRGSRLQISYFQVQGRAEPVAAEDPALFNQAFTAGDALVAGYKLHNVKISWNYLTYPSPPDGAKLRIRTLWEVQYTTMHSKIDAPNDENAARAAGTKNVIFPTLGLGLDYRAARNIRLEAKASGFALIHRADLYDAQASAVVRIGRVGVHAGARIFHVKTSPRADQYYAATLWGPYVGFEWG
ncbi:MAG: hypothetical protein ACRD9L_16285, partial [Bryobacteraceae bacterium]